MSIEGFEEIFLKGADKCPKTKTPLNGFKKFTSGTEFAWFGWCPSCKENHVTIHGNNPKSKYTL